MCSAPYRCSSVGNRPRVACASRRPASARTITDQQEQGCKRVVEERMDLQRFKWWWGALALGWIVSILLTVLLMRPAPDPGPIEIRESRPPEDPAGAPTQAFDWTAQPEPGVSHPSLCELSQRSPDCDRSRARWAEASQAAWLEDRPDRVARGRGESQCRLVPGGVSRSGRGAGASDPHDRQLPGTRRKARIYAPGQRSPTIGRPTH
jgi:hypothetical protein